MLYGIGTDIIEVHRIKEATQRRPTFLERVFTLGEKEACFKRKDPYPSLAARFAAKEAVLKALGLGLSVGVRWTDIEVLRNPQGKPAVSLTGAAKAFCENQGIQTIEISLSHCEAYAMAMAIALGKKKRDEGEEE